MMEPKENDLSSSSQTSGSLMNREEGQLAFQKPVGLTLTVERIDFVLAGVQAQIETLRRDKTNLSLVRVELAGMETKWKGE